MAINLAADQYDTSIYAGGKKLTKTKLTGMQNFIILKYNKA